MPIDERLLEILVCPACQGAIAANDDESGIQCGDCRRVYPIRDGIPVMLVDEATKAAGVEKTPLG
ncbi:MAG: Trm112 family protein [Acidobacteriota bacterium]|nr:Trm112 family protein [Acidobacteriota bacterium]